MNKNEFLQALRQKLSGLPEADVARSLEYYSEIIDDHVEDGLSEAEAVAALGSLDDIAQQILQEIPLQKLVKERIKPRRALKAGEIVLLILGAPVWLPLLIAALAIVFTVYVVLWVVVVSLYAIDLALAAAAVGGVVALITACAVGLPVFGFICFGFGLAAAGLAILMFFGCNQVAKAMASLSKKIFLWIKSWFVKKGETK